MSAPEQLVYSDGFGEECKCRVIQKGLALTFKGWRPEDIRSINAPALVMFGGADIVRPEHAVELIRLLPHSQLAVLPETDHGLRLEGPDWLLSMIAAFLNAPMPKAE